MNRTEAMKSINEILENNFKYVYKKYQYDIQTLHLTFLMDLKTHNLQMSFRFEEKWVDILCFISPTIPIDESNLYLDVLQTINYINWNVKTFGRFYFDTNGDFAYSLRFKYEFLEREPEICAKEIEATVDFYADIFILAIEVVLSQEIGEAKLVLMNLSKVNSLTSCNSISSSISSKYLAS